ncbi:hypothetical protein [Candidatus Ruthturnera calyptogenae]|uniref:hypothetical protein n=1 Tax=Candidatus Ruthturnera calyptogenae TaxID=386487 RepID=UPI00030BF590|nr:hypothetical protein [Candidatus Ruthturnera calyptogenae]
MPKHELKSIIGDNTVNQMEWFWFKKEINLIEDLQELKIRILGFESEYFSR